MQDRDLEILRHRLTQRDVTIEEVHQYIRMQHPPNATMSQQPLQEFISAEDLVHYWALVDWWDPVPDKPVALATPPIISLCWNINYTPGTEPVSFYNAMFKFWNKASQYCLANDIDLNNPAETAEERRRRRNRERMAKVRGTRKVPQKLLRGNDELSTQVRDLEAQIEELKVEAKEVDDNLRAETIRHQDAMIEASQRRKVADADFKNRIENLRTEIRNLTHKQ